jgi:hypothetical protein
MWGTRDPFWGEKKRSWAKQAAEKLFLEGHGFSR